MPPTPPCENGTGVTSPAANPGLMDDCVLLLAAKDTLRGTETNWSVDTAIANWEGITVSGSPSRVTGLHLDRNTSGPLYGRTIPLSATPAEVEGATPEADAPRRLAGAPGECSQETLLRITARRAEVLREIADGYSGRDAARRMGITFSGLRSHIEALKGITGCSSSRDLGRWWRRHRNGWLATMSVQAGVTSATDDTAPPP